MCAQPRETGDPNFDQKFWSTFEHANIGMALVLPDGRFQRVNPEFCRLLGYSESQLKELDLQTVTQRDDFSKEMRLLRQGLKGKNASFRIDKRFVKKNGKPLSASVSAIFERDRAGQPLHFIYLVNTLAEPTPAPQPEIEKAIVPVVQAADQLECEDRLFQFLEAVPMSLFVIDGAGLPYYANRPARELLGIGSDPNGPGGDPLAGAYGIFVAGTDEAYPEERMPIVRAVYGEGSKVADMEIQRPEGPLPVQATGSPIYDSNGEIIFALAAFEDVSGHRSAQDEIQIAHDRYMAICENVHDLITVHDLRGIYRFASQASSRLLGYEPSQLVGTDARVYIHPDDLPIVGKTFQRYLAGSDEHMRATYRIRRKDGEYNWVETGARPIVGTYGIRREILCVTHDLAEGKEMQASLLEENRNLREIDEVSTTIDSTTGVNDRLALDEHLEKCLSSRRASTYPLGCLLVDIDGFRKINDKYGHAVGDDVLRKVAAITGNACRVEDFIGRYGSDEFLVLLANTDAAGTVVVGEKLISNVQTAYRADTPVLENITVSIGGVCINRYTGISPSELIDTLNVQLSDAKQGGHNRMVMNARLAVSNQWAGLSGR